LSDDDEDTQRAEKLARRRQLEKHTHLTTTVEASKVSQKEIGHFTWDDLLGHEHVKKDARDLVWNVNNGKSRDAAKGMLIHGPPGVGKDMLVNIMTCKMRGATLFDIPHDFGARTPGIWEYLIDIAYKNSPAIIYFNECDGVFNSATTVAAIKRAWNEGIETGGYVLMLGSTNNVTKIDDAIVNRFGIPYEFDPLARDERRQLIKRKILNSFDEAERVTLDAAGDSEWTKVLDLIPEDRNPRYIVVDLIPKVKSCYNRQVGEEGRATPISLADFEARLSATPVDNANERVVQWVKKTFILADTEDRNRVGGGEREWVVPLFDDVMLLMPTNLFLGLGPKSESIRVDKSAFARDHTFIVKLKTCFEVALPGCEVLDLGGNISKVRISRSHDSGEYTTVEQPGKYRRGRVLRFVRYKLDLLDA
jgi:hypothetical protein